MTSTTDRMIGRKRWGCRCRRCRSYRTSPTSMPVLTKRRLRYAEARLWRREQEAA